MEVDSVVIIAILSMSYITTLTVVTIAIKFSPCNTIKYLFISKNIPANLNCNVAVECFAIFDKNVATTFQSE